LVLPVPSGPWFPYWYLGATSFLTAIYRNVDADGLFYNISNHTPAAVEPPNTTEEYRQYGQISPDRYPDKSIATDIFCSIVDSRYAAFSHRQTGQPVLYNDGAVVVDRTVIRQYTYDPNSPFYHVWDRDAP